MPDRRNRSVERDWKSHSAPSRNGLVYQAAVTPGHLYQAFKEEAVKQFPSGKFALALAGDYYQFYVGSEIMKEEKRVGAVIQFA